MVREYNAREALVVSDERIFPALDAFEDEGHYAERWVRSEEADMKEPSHSL